MLSVKTGTMIL